MYNKIQWEYKVMILHGTCNMIEKELNMLGEESWECINNNEGMFTFKRKIDQRKKK